jgi:ribonuclease D
MIGMTSLKAVVKNYLPGIELDKAHQGEDWSIPHLPPEMISFSLKDSRVLLDLTTVLMNRLESLDMGDLVHEIESRALPSKI